jgi:L-ascorbate metabolism protein UlaG (beta-lactamase superfamily)
MKPAFQKDSQFIADVRRALRAGEFRLWWLGQSGFLVVRNGRAIVLDPYLSDSLTEKYRSTDKPHVRMTERVVDPVALAELGVIDLVVSSHNHTDHFDPETLVPLLIRNASAVLVLPEANRQIGGQRLTQVSPGVAASHWDICLRGLDDGETIAVAGIEVRGIAAAHNTIERDENGHCRFLGYVVRWGGWSIYHSGDTLLHDGLVPALRPLNIDMALLPINGNKPERRVAGNLDGREAATLAHDIGARCVVPCHYDLFEFNTETPDDFIAECRRIGQVFQVLRNGEGWGGNSKLTC